MNKRKRERERESAARGHIRRQSKIKIQALVSDMGCGPKFHKDDIDIRLKVKLSGKSALL